MKHSYLLSRAFSSCTVLVILAACGGAQTRSLAGAQSQSTLRVNPNSKLSGEALSGTKVRVYYPHKQCPFFGVSIVSFIASGTATGPYPCLFKAKGQWTSHPGGKGRLPATDFRERFRIISGSVIYSGRVRYSTDQHDYGNCTSVAIGQARYRSKSLNASGTAAVTIAKRLSGNTFAEEFYQLQALSFAWPCVGRLCSRCDAGRIWKRPDSMLTSSRPRPFFVLNRLAF